jgi:hypothetical protein
MAGNIIHAIATTNAIISGLIVIEAMKLLAGAPPLPPGCQAASPAQPLCLQGGSGPLPSSPLPNAFPPPAAGRTGLPEACLATHLNTEPNVRCGSLDAAKADRGFDPRTTVLGAWCRSAGGPLVHPPPFRALTPLSLQQGARPAGGRPAGAQAPRQAQRGVHGVRAGAAAPAHQHAHHHAGAAAGQGGRGPTPSEAAPQAPSADLRVLQHFIKAASRLHAGCPVPRMLGSLCHACWAPCAMHAGLPVPGAAVRVHLLAGAWHH